LFTEQKKFSLYRKEEESNTNSGFKNNITLKN